MRKESLPGEEGERTRSGSQLADSSEEHLGHWGNAGGGQAWPQGREPGAGFTQLEPCLQGLGNKGREGMPQHQEPGKGQSARTLHECRLLA